MKLRQLLATLFFSWLFAAIPDPAAARTCLATEPGDSLTFGSALAVNDDYLAVGDPAANRVILYRRTADGGWERWQEIVPPVGSTADRYGRGFGYSLDLEGDRLVVGTFDDKRFLQWQETNATENFGALYVVDVSSRGDIQVEEISAFPKVRLSFARQVSFFGDRIAVTGQSIVPGDRSRIERGASRVFILNRETQQIERVIGPPRESEKDIDWPQLEITLVADIFAFGFDLSRRKSSLLISNPGRDFSATSSQSPNVYLLKPSEEPEGIEFQDISGVEHLPYVGWHLSLEKDFLAASSAPNSLFTSFFSKDVRGIWSHIGTLRFNGPIDIKGQYALISKKEGWPRPSFISGSGIDHVLARIGENHVEVEVELLWSPNHLMVTMNGLIDSDNLILSRRGKVAWIPISDLNEFHVIDDCP